MNRNFVLGVLMAAIMAVPLGGWAQEEAQGSPASGPTSYDMPAETNQGLTSYDAEIAANAVDSTGRVQVLEEPKRFRLLLERPFLMFNYLRDTPEGGEAVSTSNFNTTFVSPLTRFGFAFAINDLVHVGMRLTLDVDVQSVEGESFPDIAWETLPFVEFVFGTKKVRPFVMATVGAVGHKTDTVQSSDDPSVQPSADISRSVSFALGAGGGLRLHPASWISFDLNALGLWTIGADWTGEGAAELKKRVSTVDLQLGWGVSLWI